LQIIHNPREEDMTHKLMTLFAAAAVLSTVSGATIALAKETTPSPQPPQTEGTMGDHGGTMNMMGQMSPDHMKQMTQMVGNCNRMIESMSNTPMGPEKERAAGTHG
jgi:hypothetical protein